MADAAVTTVKSELKTAIEAATFALPLTVVIADSAADPLPPAPYQFHAADPNNPDDPGDTPLPMQVQIAFKGVAELGRTSSLVLDQALIDVNLAYRHTGTQQTNLDVCHLVAEQMRDLLISFRTDAVSARVEQLLTPNPFDQVNCLQGMFNHRLTLDMDILRTIATVEAPTVTDSPILTATRNAVWDAIDNWTPFAADDPIPAAWTRKYRDAVDVEELSLHDPDVGDLPAIAVTWGPTSTQWWTNIQQQWSQQLFVTFWLPANWEAVAEWRLIQLMQAIYKSAPVETPTVSYIRRAVGRPPSKNSPVSLELVALGRAQRLHAWKGQIALTLTTNLDPNA
ncbi:MAG: hypothetical protein JSS49_27485 [Planctomycetes bacterium]|nr:hypothetical protein [Planctomycetota bacterium]